MKYARFLIAAALVGFFALPAAAENIDYFDITFDEQGQFVGGGGSGFVRPTGEGPWFYYPNTDWWNQWFYDHPFTWDKWKVIDLQFGVRRVDPAADALLTFAINWSLPPWSPNPDTPPVPPLTPDEESRFIGREVIFELDDISPDDPTWFYDFHYEIREYNPEWVSVDVRGLNVEIIEGVITHDCIPEPTVLTSLIGLGAMVGLLGICRWRRKR